MKKSKMIRKRLASMILSFVMLFGEFYSAGMTVFAGDGDVRISEDDPAATDPGDDVTEDEEVLYEGSSEETAEETDEDMPAQEPASDEDVIVDDFDTEWEVLTCSLGAREWMKPLNCPANCPPSIEPA